MIRYQRVATAKPAQSQKKKITAAAKKSSSHASAAKHTDATLFTAWALWLVGLSEAKIGTVVGKNRKQISGIIARSPYPNRSAMTKAQRQTELDKLIRARMGDDGKPLDGGVLDRIPHQVMELNTRQQKGGSRNVSGTEASGPAQGGGGKQRDDGGG